MIAPALLAGAFFCMLPEATATARDLSQDEALQLRRAGKVLALDSLLQKVRERYPAARLLDAELETDDGRLIYELEVVTADGVVRELELDAGNGAILKDEEED